MKESSRFKESKSKFTPNFWFLIKIQSLKYNIQLYVNIYLKKIREFQKDKYSKNLHFCLNKLMSILDTWVHLNSNTSDKSF